MVSRDGGSNKLDVTNGWGAKSERQNSEWKEDTKAEQKNDGDQGVGGAQDGYDMISRHAMVASRSIMMIFHS